MKKIYPTSACFTLADNLNEEAGNKLSLIGVYTGDAIRLRDYVQLPTTLNSLALLAVLRGGEGRFKVNLDVFSPSGQQIFVGQPVDANVNQSGNMVIRNKFESFPIRELGTYRVQMALDKRPDNFEFKILKPDLTTAPPADLQH